MEELSVLACAGELRGDGGLPVAEDPFGQRCQHHCDLLGKGFQPVQRRVASSTERGAALLTAKGLDLRIGDAEVLALLIGTGETLSIDAFGCSPTTFHLTPGTYWFRPCTQ